MHGKKDEDDSILEKSIKNAEGAVDPITGEVYYSFEEYTNSLKERTGIDIYELVEKPYFHEYMNFLDDYKSFFMERVRYDESIIDEMRILWNEIIELSDDSYESDQHFLYQKYEEISISFFGDNFNHIEVYEGVEYRIARNKLEELITTNSILKTQIISEYSHFNNLTKDNQNAIVQAAISGFWCLNCGLIDTNDKYMKLSSGCETIALMVDVAQTEYDAALVECGDSKRCAKKAYKEMVKIITFLLSLEPLNC